MLTLNEDHNVEFCLRSLRTWCDEIVVVDMGSEDRTLQIVARYGARVVPHERIAEFDAARQAGVDNATGDWILSIDADEVVTPKLARWIRDFVDSNPPYEVARIPRVNVFLGRRMHSTPWWPGKPRLFRKGAVRISGELHHGITPLPEMRVAQLPKSPGTSLWHFTRTSVEGLTDKTNRYTTIEARQAIQAGRGDPRVIDLFNGALRELAVYAAKRGYRDGLGGFIYVMNRAWYKFLVAAKRWDMPRSGARQARYDDAREDIVRGFGEMPWPQSAVEETSRERLRTPA